MGRHALPLRLLPITTTPSPAGRGSTWSNRHAGHGGHTWAFALLWEDGLADRKPPNQAGRRDQGPRHAHRAHRLGEERFPRGVRVWQEGPRDARSVGRGALPDLCEGPVPRRRHGLLQRSGRRVAAPVGRAQPGSRGRQRRSADGQRASDRRQARAMGAEEDARLGAGRPGGSVRSEELQPDGGRRSARSSSLPAPTRTSSSRTRS